jgi:hypothetical protein
MCSASAAAHAAAERIGQALNASDTTGLLSGEGEGRSDEPDGAFALEMSAVQQGNVMAAEQKINAALAAARADLASLGRLQSAAQQVTASSRALV